MRVLGIDPGYGRVGWGVIEEENRKMVLHACGTIETAAKDLLPKRLQVIATEVKKIIETYTPHEMAVEELFFTTNAKTAISVAQGRGVILLTGEQSGVPIAEYTPLEVKMAITGYGKAVKTQVAEMVQITLRLDSLPKVDDTTDALAIALTHLYSRKMKGL
jgi:crossover junction endodeoxyribonuclease RuvC